MDLSTPNTREKYLLKTNCLHFFSLWATAVDRCDITRQPSPCYDCNGHPVSVYNGPFNLHLHFWKWGWQLKLSQFANQKKNSVLGTEFLGTEFLRTEFLRTELLRTVFLSYECITLGHRLIFKCNEFTLFALLFILG